MNRPRSLINTQPFFTTSAQFLNRVGLFLIDLLRFPKCT